MSDDAPPEDAGERQDWLVERLRAMGGDLNAMAANEIERLRDLLRDKQDYLDF